MSVWDDLVGQDRVVEQLTAAAKAARASVLAGRTADAPAGNYFTHCGYYFAGAQRRILCRRDANHRVLIE